jgi:hypothetical protein
MILGYLLIILAGVSEAVMDKVQFHYNKSIFSKLNGLFWDPSISWKNKWKSDLKTERFRGSSNIFVFTTDAWHLFKFLRNLFLFIGIPLICYDTEHIIIVCIVARILFGLSFTLFFDKLFSN